MLGSPFAEEIFPNIQPKAPLVQLEVISSHPKGTVMPLLAFTVSNSNNFEYRYQNISQNHVL